MSSRNYHLLTNNMLDLDIFLLSCICPSNIGVDLTGILVGTHDGTYYKSPAVEAKKHIFLHCNASNLVFKILIHDKIGGGQSSLQILGATCPPRSPVIYAHAFKEISSKTK